MTCDAYIPDTPKNKVGCFQDVNDEGIRKQDACAECGKCIPHTTNPTSSPTSSASPTNAPTNTSTNIPTNVPTNAPTPICEDRMASFKMKDEKTKRKCGWVNESATKRMKRCYKKVK